MSNWLQRGHTWNLFKRGEYEANIKMIGENYHYHAMLKNGGEAGRFKDLDSAKRHCEKVCGVKTNPQLSLL